MSAPKLTIGIPTQGKRPERLLKAIGSCLEQTVPVAVVVCDQKGEASEVLEPYLEHDRVRYLISNAETLWENWTNAALACETEYFAWLQDDDIIRRYFAARVVSALDRHENASCWIARLAISRMPGLGNWWEATGPSLPMDLLDNSPATIQGEMLAVVSYFTSFALSPGVAFRNNEACREAVKNTPGDADLFAERSILAELGKAGSCVVDPAIIGYWVQHDSNESKNQNESDGERERQFARMCQHIDPIVMAIPHWEPMFRAWVMMAGEHSARHYHDATRGHDGKSPILAAMRETIRTMWPGIKEKEGVAA